MGGRYLCKRTVSAEAHLVGCLHPENAYKFRTTQQQRRYADHATRKEMRQEEHFCSTS